MHNLSSKKGLIVFGAPRSGSHMLTDSFYRLNKQNTDGVWVGELFPFFNNENVYEILDSYNTFIFCSIVNYRARAELLKDPARLGSYYVVNIRRKNKIEQFTSWSLFKLQQQINFDHSLTWDTIKDQLPITATIPDIRDFIRDQDLDLQLAADQIVYYEDIQSVNTRYVKNSYPQEPEQIFSNFKLVEKTLKNYKYEI